MYSFNNVFYAAAQASYDSQNNQVLYTCIVYFLTVIFKL